MGKNYFFIYFWNLKKINCSRLLIKEKSWITFPRRALVSTVKKSADTVNTPKGPGTKLFHKQENIICVASSDPDAVCHIIVTQTRSI